MNNNWPTNKQLGAVAPWVNTAALVLAYKTTSRRYSVLALGLATAGLYCGLKSLNPRPNH